MLLWWLWEGGVDGAGAAGAGAAAPVGDGVRVAHDEVDGFEAEGVFGFAGRGGGGGGGGGGGIALLVVVVSLKGSCVLNTFFAAATIIPAAA